ncbi:MAG: hypothetical protein JW847_05980 [Candidatus Omnitrophica bacterium]|nr:hypothetical protein [Candidatus Omnitrophota bacterium]
MFAAARRIVTGLPTFAMIAHIPILMAAGVLVLDRYLAHAYFGAQIGLVLMASLVLISLAKTQLVLAVAELIPACLI